MIVLFGAAGSGKSLQGQKLADKYGWRWLSVGQLLREQENPELDKIMKTGGLVDDGFVVNMMHEAIVATESDGKNAILDGYPRDQWQANWVVEHGDSKKIDGAIILKVSEEELWRRLEERGRADDTRESIEQRWKIFKTTIADMRKILESDGVEFKEVDGEGDKDEITRRIEQVLTEWQLIEPVAEE